MTGPLVSIIMPTYNCGRFIAESIESVINQVYDSWELLIVDDCSTDNTKAIVKRYRERDRRIRYLPNKTNMGAALSRNRALRAAKGRYIAFLDSDDVWMEEKLIEQLTFMQRHNYAFTYHAYKEIEEHGFPLHVRVSGPKRITHLGMMACCWPGCLTVMYDRKVIGRIQIPDIKKNNDTAMWLQVSKKADCYLLGQCLARYRRRKGSITPPSITQRIRWHYVLFREGMKMNPVVSAFWTCVNIVCNSYKKLRYVEHIFDGL